MQDESKEVKRLVMVTVRMRPEDRDELNRRAVDEDRSLNALCLRLLFPERPTPAKLDKDTPKRVLTRREVAERLEAIKANKPKGKARNVYTKAAQEIASGRDAEGIPTGGLGDYFPK